MKNLPIALIYSRVALGIAIGSITVINLNNLGLITCVLMFVGILTDIFDGIIARKLQIDTKKLRILDSNVDLFFWLVCIGSIFWVNTDFLIQNWMLIGCVLLSEIVAYLISFFKFRKPIATHTYLAKFWSILLFLFLCEISLTNQSDYFYHPVIWIGLISRTEIIAILLVSKKWLTDVSSIILIRYGK